MKQALRGISIGLAIGTLCSASIAAAEPDWVRSEKFDQNLSFETPCAPHELVVTERGGEEFGTRESEARCEKSGLTYDVHIFEVLIPTKGKPFYDRVLAGFAKAGSAKGKRVSLTIPGHRASFDQDELDGLAGQRGFIEISSSKVALVMAGGIPEGGADLDVQRKSLEHFFGSLQVRG